MAMVRSSATWGAGLLAFAMASAALPSAAGAQVVVGPSVGGDRIYAQWENPVTHGSLLDAVTRLPYGGSSVDTTATAVYDLGGPPSATATLSWGDFPGATSPPPPNSTVTFTGNIIPDDGTKGTTPFSLGSVSYTNGTSENGTQIFGATLDFYADAGGNLIPIGSDFVALTATVNDGDTDAQNADYVNFAGLPLSFNVYEGDTASGQLNGVIVGDPMAHLTSFTLDPGQDANGFIGNDAPAPVPEPSGWAMMLAGLFGVGAVLRSSPRRGLNRAASA
jgi:hypothetical protein